MKLLKFFFVAVVFTVLALVYIHLQVQIYDLGYKGELKKTELQKQNDFNGYLNDKILRLTSANHLGVKLLKDDSRMQFLDGHRIITLKNPALNTLSLQGQEKSPNGHRQNLLAGIFSLRSQAEAGSIK